MDPWKPTYFTIIMDVDSSKLTIIQNNSHNNTLQGTGRWILENSFTITIPYNNAKLSIIQNN